MLECISFVLTNSLHDDRRMCKADQYRDFLFRGSTEFVRIIAQTFGRALSAVELNWFSVTVLIHIWLYPPGQLSHADI